MSSNTPFMIMDQPCNEAVAWITQQIQRAGLRVVRTFDLSDARHAHVGCPCLNHGTTECDCQMVVLLVYGRGHQPVSLVAHGYDGKTWITVVDTPQQRADPQLEGSIHQALALSVMATLVNHRDQYFAT